MPDWTMCKIDIIFWLISECNYLNMYCHSPYNLSAFVSSPLADMVTLILCSICWGYSKIKLRGGNK